MARSRSPRPAPVPSLDARGRLQRRGLAALGATGGPESRVRIGRSIRIEGQTLDPPTQAMLELLRRLHFPPVYGQEVPEARTSFRREALVASGRATPVAAAEDLQVDGAAGPLPARLYRPGSVRNLAQTWQPGADRLPLLVFFHGGGFVLGDLDSHDATCRLLCSSAGILVLSVAYRLAPEHPFPAAPEDALAAWRWATEHAHELGADVERLAVGGDSAGANLAAGVALADARADTPQLALQLLLYPPVDVAGTYDSRLTFGSRFYLEQQTLSWFERLYLGDDLGQPGGVDPTDPRLSPLHAENLSGLAPALVVTAGFDPLRDEAEAYAEALRAAGTPVLTRRMPDLIHGFASMLGVGRRSRQATLEVAALMRGMLEIAPAQRSRSAS